MKQNILKILFFSLGVLGIISVAYLFQKWRVPSDIKFFEKDFHTVEGVFLSYPYPVLVVSKKGKPIDDTVYPNSRYYVSSAKGKVSFNKEDLIKLDHQYVSMNARFIYRENQTILFTTIDKIKIESDKIKKVSSILKKSITKNLGFITIQGEIIDAKCGIGKMNPGTGQTHKTCASLCIRGGSTSLFMVLDDSHEFANNYFLLTHNNNNTPIDTRSILSIVGDLIEIKGEVTQVDNILFLQADPKTYRRL